MLLLAEFQLFDRNLLLTHLTFTIIMKSFIMNDSNYDEIRKLANKAGASGGEPLFVPYPDIHDIVKGILVTAVLLTLLYTLFLFIVAKFTLENHMARQKTAYQVTNVCANAFLGASGLYFLALQALEKQPSIQMVVQGFSNYQFLGTFQLGYQLWALSMCLLGAVQEPPAMLAHHAATLLVASMSSFCTNGFRYYTPFFYGYIELSSVPLAIMNAFKDHPAWIAKYPRAYAAVRATFGVCFLCVRVVQFTPRMYAFLRDLGTLVLAHPNPAYQAFIAAVWMCSLALQVLQLFWGVLVLKGFAGLWKRTKPKTN
jgi:hypothetical protein